MPFLRNSKSQIHDKMVPVRVYLDNFDIYTKINITPDSRSMKLGDLRAFWCHIFEIWSTNGPALSLQRSALKLLNYRNAPPKVKKIRFFDDLWLFFVYLYRLFVKKNRLIFCLYRLFVKKNRLFVKKNRLFFLSI